jgi:hypothetical protein
MGYNGGASSGGSDNGFYFAMNASKSLIWTAFSAAHATSGWSVYWFIQGYNNNSYFTVRTITKEFDSILGTNVDRAYYMQSSATSVSIQDGFSSQTSGLSSTASLPTTNLQFSFEQAFTGNKSVWHIKSVLTGSYCSYGLSLSVTPVAFFLKR